MLSEQDRHSYIVEPKLTPKRMARVNEAKTRLDHIRLMDILGKWFDYDSPLSESQYDQTERSDIRSFRDRSFEKRFCNTLPDTESANLSEYIKRVLASVRHKAIGIEFGGPANRLFQGFDIKEDGAIDPEPFFAETYGVIYSKPASGTVPFRPSHHIVEGNIANKNLFQFLKTELKGRKVNLIILSLVAGDRSLPKDPKIILDIFEDMYELLSYPGLMLADEPGGVFSPEKLRKWKNKLEERSIKNKSIDLTRDGSCFRLLKTENSPEKLFTIK